MEYESKYFEHYVKINKQYSRINHTLKSLISVYESNIHQKFKVMYFTVFNEEPKSSSRLPNKYEETMRKFKITYNDFRMDSYIRNFDTIYEIYFPMTKIISYRSKLELMYAN